MPIRVVCDVCGRSQVVGDSRAGGTVKCRICETDLPVSHDVRTPEQLREIEEQERLRKDDGDEPPAGSRLEMVKAYSGLAAGVAVVVTVAFLSVKILSGGFGESAADWNFIGGSSTSSAATVPPSSQFPAGFDVGRPPGGGVANRGSSTSPHNRFAPPFDHSALPEEIRNLMSQPGDGVTGESGGPADNAAAVRRRANLPKAPVEIESLSPVRAKAGSEITLSGRGFNNTVAVHFLGTGAVRRWEATFTVVSEDELRVVVPRITATRTPIAIVVVTSEATTVTVPASAYQGAGMPTFPGRRTFYFIRGNGELKLHGGTAFVFIAAGGSFSGNGLHTIFLQNGGSYNSEPTPVEQYVVGEQAEFDRSQPFLDDSLIEAAEVYPSFVDELFQAQ